MFLREGRFFFSQIVPWRKRRRRRNEQFGRRLKREEESARRCWEIKAIQRRLEWLQGWQHHLCPLGLPAGTAGIRGEVIPGLRNHNLCVFKRELLVQPAVLQQSE